MNATLPQATNTMPHAPATRSYLEALTDAASAYICGVIDYQKGVPAMPDDRYTKAGDKADYMDGYMDEHTAQAKQVADERQRILFRTLSTAQMEAENADYRDDMADRDYHAFGGW